MRLSFVYAGMIALMFLGLAGMMVTDGDSDAGRRTPESPSATIIRGGWIAVGDARPQPSTPTASVTPTPLVVTAAFATPTPEPTVAPTPAAAPMLGTLSREEFYVMLEMAQWEPELWPSAYEHACGSMSKNDWGESACTPGVSNTNQYGTFIGLLGVWDAWADDCLVAPEDLRQPLVNLWCARHVVMQDSLDRGLDYWWHWR